MIGMCMTAAVTAMPLWLCGAAIPPKFEQAPLPEVWVELAICESGWYGEPRWDYNGSSGFDGGLQFHPDTWTDFDGPTDFAWQATPHQQVEVAERVQESQGWNAWPTCSRKIRLIR